MANVRNSAFLSLVLPPREYDDPYIKDLHRDLESVIGRVYNLIFSTGVDGGTP